MTGDTRPEDASVAGVISSGGRHGSTSDDIEHPLAQRATSTSDQLASRPSDGEPAPISGQQREKDGGLKDLMERLDELGIESNPKYERISKRAARNAEGPVELFSGFVTFEQLQQVTADRRRLRDMSPQLIRMRGPGDATLHVLEDIRKSKTS